MGPRRMHYELKLRFAGKARKCAPLLGRLLALPANIRQACQGLMHQLIMIIRKLQL
jgi:hypothetical protein